MILTFHEPNGIVVVATDHELTERTIERLNAQYGDKWQLVLSEPICSGLCPDCGYGDPLDRNTCAYCSGKCCRPRRA
jgi:hypothetical protein